ncbi:cupredoxin domain-containing protein [Acidihalobacter yilgarnensis]|uniref:cupredoxin domain-containing protein n=1 Tax=Acidihalobacter yilgarnensis TaxID=2819280 RepID=UPI0012EA056B|nr:cupredoxin domain-containing protein [Acidihalobacter yilgarnensis]
MHNSVLIRLAPAVTSLLAVLFLPTIAAASAPSDATPVFKLIEGKAWSSYPYSPSVLHIPAGKTVALELTDNIGGCGLVTVFPHLGPQGETVSVRVPVGDTKRILIHAPKPGKYVYHCSENMWYGEIVAE